MKLYATTTSERASKGQGGEYLVIELKNEAKKVFAKFLVVKTQDNKQEIASWHNRDTNTETRFIEESSLNALIAFTTVSKGKQKKDECLEGGEHKYMPENGNKTCLKCLKTKHVHNENCYVDCMQKVYDSKYLCKTCKTGHNGQKCQSDNCTCELCHIV
jgi:hypothetical protein